jgi:exonuclease VII large subunit
MAQSAENLLVRIDATTEQLRRELRRADDGVQKFDRSVGKRLQKIDQRFQRLGRGIQGVGAALGGLAAAAGARELGRLGTQALNSAEQVQRMSDSLGVGVETVQELQFTFSRFGLQQKDVNDALATLADRAQDAIDGTKSIQEDFQAIGISVDQLRGKNPAQLMRLVADAIARTEDPSKRAAAAVRILEDEIGQRLLPLLTEGSQGFDRLAQRANEFGLVLDEALIRKGAQAAGELDTLRLAARSAFDTGVIEGFTSEFDGVEEALSSVTRLSNQFGEALGSALATVTQDADELLQRMENITRLVLGVVGAFKGSRFGVPGAIIGGTAGALSPEVMGLMTRGLGGNEQSAEEARLEALREQRDRLVERSRTMANEGESGLTEIDRRITMLNAEIEATERKIASGQSSGGGGGTSIDITQFGGTSPAPGSGGGDTSPVPAGLPGADAVSRTNDLVAQQRAELDRLGQKLQNDLNPAWARYQQRMQNLQMALDANRISQREFNQLAQQAGQQLQQATGQVDNYRREFQLLERFGDRAFDRIGSSITDAMVRGENAMVSFESVAQGVLSEVMQMFIQLAAINPLKNAILGGDRSTIGSVINAGADALSGNLGNIFGATAGATGGAAVSSSAGGLGQPLPTFADGGSFNVGSSFPRVDAGRDNRLVSFFARDGERVNVQTPQQQKGGTGGGVNVYQTINLSANGDRQVAQIAQRAAADGIRRAVPGIVSASTNNVDETMKRRPQYGGRD